MGKRKQNDDAEDDLPNGQMLLLPLPEPTEGMELLESAERQRELYPLTTVEKNQERLQSIIASIAADAPVRYVCRTHKVGWHTLQRIRDSHGPKIATLKQGIARRMSFFVQLGIEQLIEDLAAGTIAPDKLGIIVGIITDKMQVLTGEPTTIVGTGDGPKTFSIDTLNARLGRRERTVEADFTELPTGSEGGKDSATRATAAPALDQPSKAAASDAASEN